MTINKPIWAEGIFLSQQHFQQWDHYLEQQQYLQFSSTNGSSYGLIDCVIDEGALLTGHFRLQRCSAIFPGGQVIAYNSATSEPLACKLQKQSAKTIAIYLAYPCNGRANQISGYTDTTSIPTYYADYRTVSDDFDSEREREVLFARLNLKLLQENELNEHYINFKIAEVVSDDEMTFQINPDYIPAIMQTKASCALLILLTDVIELLTSKIMHIEDLRRQILLTSDMLTHSDLLYFLVLQIIHPAVLMLQHHRQWPRSSPMEVYQVLTTLLARLSTVNNSQAHYAAPRYNPDKLTEIFSYLIINIRDILIRVIPEKNRPLKLNRESEVLYSILAIDNGYFSNTTHTSFYLAVNVTEIDANINWVTQFASQVKIACRASIEAIVAAALPGVRILHTQRPPNKLTTKSGYQYFYLEPQGECWLQIKSDRTLACYIPEPFTTATVEIITVLE